jgi:D-sedoheptulose 7-phosphate isomerase
MDNTTIIWNSFDQIRAVVETLPSFMLQIEKIAQLYYDTFSRRHTVAFAGNGGSAADAQHLAAEYVGRFHPTRARHALNAIALTTDTSVLTALGNDFGLDQIFARQVAARLRKGDVLVVHSTSGNSKNIIAAVLEARTRFVITVAFLGGTGGCVRGLCDYEVIVPSTETARIQEGHMMLEHIIANVVDRMIVP